MSGSSLSASGTNSLMSFGRILDCMAASTISLLFRSLSEANLKVKASFRTAASFTPLSSLSLQPQKSGFL